MPGEMTGELDGGYLRGLKRVGLSPLLFYIYISRGIYIYILMIRGLGLMSGRPLRLSRTPGRMRFLIRIIMDDSMSPFSWLIWIQCVMC